MSAALAARNRVQFVDNNEPDRAEFLAEAWRRKQDEKRLGSGHKDMRRSAEHRVALAGGSITGAQSRPDRTQGKSELARDRANSQKRFLEIQPYIVGERLKRGDVKDRNFVAQEACLRLDDEPIDGPHEGRESLAAAGRRAKQHVMAGIRLRLANRRPSQFLRTRRCGKTAREPRPYGRMKSVENRFHGKVISSPVRIPLQAKMSDAEGFKIDRAPRSLSKQRSQPSRYSSKLQELRKLRDQLTARQGFFESRFAPGHERL